MVPPLLVERALEVNLNMIGVVDHNAAGNALAVVAAGGESLVVKPGLEVESKETVHVVCLFDTVPQALSLQDLVFRHLPAPREGDDHPFGPRLLVDRRGMALGEEPRPLYAATDLGIEEIVEAARERGGLVVAAHVERRAHGLLGVLGFVPPGLRFDGLEAGPGGMEAGRIASSDAHRLREVGSRYTVFEAEGSSVEDLRRCLAAGRFRAGVLV
jgi:hypothetical protein